LFGEEVLSLTLEERPLPGFAQQDVRRYERLTKVIGVILLYAPLVGLVLARSPSLGAITLTMVTSAAWLGYREWQFRRRLLCPTCSSRLRMEGRPSQRGHDVFSCRQCAIGWDSGRRRHEPSQNPG
jgi:hypothetical protein